MSLPADEGPHNDVYFEWWWWNGHVVTPGGQRLGFIVYFQSKPALGYQAVDVTMTDRRSRQFHYRRAAALLRSPRPEPDGISLHLAGVDATGGNGNDKIRFDVDGYRLQLTLTAVKPPVMQFGDGTVNLYCQTADYYTRPRMRISGTLTRPGASRPLPVEVSGLGYFEHAWGFVPAIDVANWTLLNFQLRDGRDIYAAELRDRPDGNEFTAAFGYVSGRGGNVTVLHRTDFTLAPTAIWQRDSTCSYPVEYDLDIGSMHFHVQPVIRQQNSARQIRSS